PRAYGPPILSKTCLYTLTPDRDFVIDTLPENPNVIVAVGAGHAFKFASVIGQILSELALKGTTDQDISAFRINRDILLAENPKTHFLV
ncbi:MAG: N-methyl-L-tryptophan oxidase, partial [Chloroflexi bacterium]|nr:N-methyl-L-tryptophan oxidase [Chloroflexota bacterium]